MRETIAGESEQHAVSQDSDTPAIRTSELSKRYGSSVLALDALSMTVNRGEIFGFLGPNGAGKTTTIRLLLDLIRPTSGRAEIFGLDCRSQSLEVRRRVGYLPGELSLYEGKGAREMLGLFASLREGQVSWDYVEHLCSELDVPMNVPSRELSHGNRQKLGIVIALMAKPDLIILDEPTTGLDPLMQRHVLDMLRDARDQGRTVFFSSHILPEVEDICDRVGIIRRGRLITVEGVESLKGKGLQRVRMGFASPVPIEEFSALEGVRVIDHDGADLHVEVAGEIDPLIKAAARHHVVSFDTERPTLEEVFMAYYEEGAKVEEATRA